MQETLRRMREKRATDDRGFTLIELLVVVVIIGVLVAIAIPLYLNYTKGAANKTAQSDVRGAVSAIEQYYTENGNKYPVDSAVTGGTNDAPLSLGTTDQKAPVSSGNTLKYKNNGSSYVLCGTSSGGKVYIYNSLQGGSVKEFAGDITACLASGSGS
ncbi:prepilin-type N-terminal cleavage/methylation domain-containing protein [Planosporangium mesophilum]|uniref:Prepilin-type N-terminal cleavage/methylation domain-containing protein n=1 Tax=Planosporangium mesophilum TaxID=689768 RepID=A0A8J3TD26_9ACTN|nr:prepilin-type N-terminal cleavage/methylation domain-containing protein [Planosporangium mesophilum]NJC85600.1 prepilin-type N-terminal cleavage/methylation domain-containing protein [Planosporangium mesophilum]GII24533.1 hypothetical protein Pme01_41300 [Planosporangium mesophilum]